jgi:hypothetical protein
LAAAQHDLGAGDDQVVPFDPSGGLADLHDLGPPARLFADPQGSHGGPTPYGDDQVRPRRLERVGARAIDVVERRPHPRLALDVGLAHGKALALAGPGKGCCHDFRLGVVARLVAQHQPNPA